MYQNLLVNGKWNSDLLKQERWLYYLLITDHDSINRERVEVIGAITGKETLEYVFRSLEILKQLEVSDTERYVLEKVLQWSEVSKGGTREQRKLWEQKKYALDIHNLSSAEIYLDETTKDEPYRDLIYMLIQTHGIIGQCIRGEVSVVKNKPIYDYMKTLKKQDEIDFFRLLVALNHCVIGAVASSLWLEVKPQVLAYVDNILSGNFTEYTTKERMARLSGKLTHPSLDTIKLFERDLFPHYDLWYFDSAFCAFSEEQIAIILEMILSDISISEIHNLNFKPLADSLYYDYEGRKHLNVYKLRIIEKYLRDDSTANVSLDIKRVGSSLSFDFTFSKVCEKLIEFCIEAERSGLLSFEKSINVLYEMFEFKRDEFDRLNNEDKYLSTMNDAASSKMSIADYVVGKTVVDVGSGGGVMLNLLEEKYPDKTVIGTDISTNVLTVLEEKKEKEQHRWNTLRHNFVEGPLAEKVDSIVFSSILHEIYSYTETENGRFDISSVKKALKNAYDSLNDGGRIIIRDGVKTDSNDILMIELLDAKGLEFFHNYKRDFEGLVDVNRNITEHGTMVSGDINFMREFLFTYTWGTESYSHEVLEQFGYFTLKEFCEFFEELGANILEAKEFLEIGYYEHLKELVKLNFSDYPCSNCIIVVEK